MLHRLTGGRIATSLALLGAGLTSSAAAWAEDWGAYAIVPSSAPAFVLEAVGAGTTDGGVVSIGKPAGGANQKWVVTPQADGWCAIRPLSSPTLALAIARGKDAMGTPAVLEADRGRPWQRWRLVRNDDDGSYCLLPAHAAGQGLDHFGGVAKPGARVDLWSNRPGDTHLRWVMKPLAGTSPPSVAAESGPVAYVPPEIKPEDVPRGVLKEFTFARSAVFPGTVRAVTVFIPRQYDGSRPACVYVKTDGYNAAEKALLETMIATKEIPVTVGVFVRPGDLPATVQGTSGRRNRCFEYDGVGDNNVRFLVDELLPQIAREYNLKLSPSGNDRCIAGGSSGGITAFNAAWERPDAFSRVYAVSGSFVAFRGGHEFPTLVRKFEAKPIRAYLTTGTHDMENCAGDWFLLDQEMDKALKFSGYDYVFKIINGGHGAGYFDQFRAAMSYLWKDWPRPVEAGASAPRVRDVILPGEPWRLVDDAPRDAKAPVCNARGDVFFVNAAADAVERIGRDGKISVFVPDAGRADGLTCDAEGRLCAVSGATGKVVRYDGAGAASLVADGLPGRHLLAMPGGGLYVTLNADGPGGSGSVWFVKDGKKTRVDAGLKRATGLAYRPDQWLLSVADGASKWVYSYRINPDGTLADKERFFWLHVPDWEDDAGAESVCYAKEGQMFVATRWGVQVCADDGPTQVILPLPDRARVVGLCIGGPDLDTLYAFGGGKIWKRKLKVHAVGAFSPWTPVRGTPL